MGEGMGRPGLGQRGIGRKTKWDVCIVRVGTERDREGNKGGTLYGKRKGGETRKEEGFWRKA